MAPHTCFLRLHLRGNQGAPPFLCPSITVPFIMISPFLCSIICPHRFLPHLYPHLPVSPGPHALSSCPLPPSVSLLCHRLLSSLLGLWPRCLPGHPPWLPLCGSELAPPPTPPLARPLICHGDRVPGTRPLGPRTDYSPSAPTEEPPAEGMGVGCPNRYVPPHRPWAGVPGLTAIPPPSSLLGHLCPNIPPSLLFPLRKVLFYPQ